MSQIITITENELVSLIRRAISEQIDGKATFGSIESHGYRQGDASTLGPALKRQEEQFRQIGDFFSDPHNVLNSLSIGLTVLGMIPSPASPFLLALGTAADVADSFLYVHEGDKYMGGIMFALAVIPGGEFLKATKNTIAPAMLKKLIRKASNGIDTLTKGELSILKNNLLKFEMYKSVIGTYLKRNIAEKIVAYLPKWIKTLPFKLTYKLIYKLFKISGFLSKLTFKIGGTYFSADTVYLWLYGNDDDRKKSSVQKLVNIIKNKPQTEEEMKNQLSEIISTPEAKSAMKSGAQGIDPKEFELLIKSKMNK
jgi:hypothetical protein